MRLRKTRFLSFTLSHSIRGLHPRLELETFPQLEYT